MVATTIIASVLAVAASPGEGNRWSLTSKALLTLAGASMLLAAWTILATIQ